MTADMQRTDQLFGGTSVGEGFAGGGELFGVGVAVDAGVGNG